MTEEKSKSFEHSIERLEAIVKRMEQGDVPLEEALGLFREGTQLVQTCTEALDKADFILAGIDGDHLLQAVDVAVEMNRNGDLGTPVPDYTDENVSDKVVKIIQSYTGVVNKMVWRKY